MLCKRIIARLDIKGPNLVKGVHLEGLRIIGDPKEYAYRYMMQGADELFYVDTVASLYGRNHLIDIINSTARKVFIPLTVGGGVSSTDHIRTLLCAGADKVSINTALFSEKDLITKGAHCFGSQAIVVSIQAKKRGEKRWEAYAENGRQKTGKDVLIWIKEVIEAGAGEILLTSIDQEGTMKGFDWELLEEASKICTVPLIVGGGAGSTEDIVRALSMKGVDAVCIASILHYGKLTLPELKTELMSQGIPVRLVDQVHNQTKSGSDNI